MVWLLRRIDDVLYNPAILASPSTSSSRRSSRSMKNKQLLDGALASIKTVRKNLGGVTMIGQSANDLGENADSIVNSCTSFLFLPDATFNRKRYARTVQDERPANCDLFESLRDREGAIYASRWADEGSHAQSRQPQLRQVLNKAKGQGTTIKAHRKVRTQRRHFAVCPGRDSITDCIHAERTECHETILSLIFSVLRLALAAASATLLPNQPHPLSPSAPRTVVATRAEQRLL